MQAKTISFVISLDQIRYILPYEFEEFFEDSFKLLQELEHAYIEHSLHCYEANANALGNSPLPLGAAY